MAPPQIRGGREMVMVMNGFDTIFDDENEFYCCTRFSFADFDGAIRVQRARLPVRIYLVNLTEFDPDQSSTPHAHFLTSLTTARR